MMAEDRLREGMRKAIAGFRGVSGEDPMIASWMSFGNVIQRIVKAIAPLVKHLQHMRLMQKHPGPNTYSKAKRRGPTGKRRGC